MFIPRMLQYLWPTVGSQWCYRPNQRWCMMYGNCKVCSASMIICIYYISPLNHDEWTVSYSNAMYLSSSWLILILLTVDINVGVGEVVAMFVANVTLDNLSVFCRHIHKRQVIQQSTKTPRVSLQLCNITHTHTQTLTHINNWQWDLIIAFTAQLTATTTIKTETKHWSWHRDIT